MDQVKTLEQLREIMLSAPESGSTRLLAVALAICLMGGVLFLVRTHRLREEFTPIWVGVAIGFLAVSLRLDLLQAVTIAIGAWTPSSTIFFFANRFLIGVCLNYAVRLSQASVQLKNLAQEVALLNARLDERASGESSDAPGPESNEGGAPS